jgi:hypothetical protein
MAEMQVIQMPAVISMHLVPTLYHLLTNRAPVEARERFLHPDSLVMPRQLNQEISPRTERAIYGP